MLRLFRVFPKRRQQSVNTGLRTLENNSTTFREQHSENGLSLCTRNKHLAGYYQGYRRKSPWNDARITSERKSEAATAHWKQRSATRGRKLVSPLRWFSRALASYTGRIIYEISAICAKIRISIVCFWERQYLRRYRPVLVPRLIMPNNEPRRRARDTVRYRPDYQQW